MEGASIVDANGGKLLYSLVARGTTVLAEYTSTTGNFPTITRVLLSKIQPLDGKMSYNYDSYSFHYVVENGLIYLCMADNNCKRRIAFAYLNAMKEYFISSYDLEMQREAIAFQMNEEFSQVLRQQMDYYNTDPDADHISRVQFQLEEVKGVMVDNIEKILRRGEKIELLVDRTSRMQQHAFVFKKSATNLRLAVWWKNCKWWTVVISLVGILALFVSMLACGGPTFKNC